MSDTRQDLPTVDLGTLDADSVPLALRLNLDVPESFDWNTAEFQFVIVNLADPSVDIAQGTIEANPGESWVQYTWHAQDLDTPGRYRGQLWVRFDAGNKWEPTNVVEWAVARRTPTPF